jgi:hypothetical protein
VERINRTLSDRLQQRLGVRTQINSQFVTLFLDVNYRPRLNCNQAQAFRFYLPEAEPGCVTANGLTAPASYWGFFLVPLKRWSAGVATGIKTSLVIRNDPFDNLERKIA